MMHISIKISNIDELKETTSMLLNRSIRHREKKIPLSDKGIEEVIYNLKQELLQMESVGRITTLYQGRYGIESILRVARGLLEEQRGSEWKWRNSYWIKFKDDKNFCEQLGCNKDVQYYCCPDLDSTLCKPKAKLLKEIGIDQEELHYNIFTKEDIVEKSRTIEERCKFDIAWIGICKKRTAEGEVYCKEHLKVKCRSCGGQATHECDSVILSLVCGMPLCEECRHNHWEEGSL